MSEVLVQSFTQISTDSRQLDQFILQNGGSAKYVSSAREIVFVPRLLSGGPHHTDIMHIVGVDESNFLTVGDESDAGQISFRLEDDILVREIHGISGGLTNRRNLPDVERRRTTIMSKLGPAFRQGRLIDPVDEE